MALVKQFSSKAQVLNQVVVYILAAIVFILILSYGYTAITHFLEKGKTVALLTFKTDLEHAVESIRRDYLSTRTLTLTIPPGFTTLCIVDTEHSGTLQTSHPLLYTIWRTGSENIFLLPLTQQTSSITLQHIEVHDAQDNQGFFCLEPVQNTIALQLEGLGNRVKITPKQS